MEENFEGVLKKEWHREDLKSLTSQINEHECLLRLKRRWLMDLPLSIREQKRVEEILPPNDKMLPESLLRDDDVSYEDVRTCIEKGFGAHDCERVLHCVQKEVQVFNSQDVFRDIFFLLNDMNNKALCSFIKILGMTEFEKTNWSMKRTIRGLLQKVIDEKGHISETQSKQLFQILKDPKSFHGIQMVYSTASEAYHAAAVKVLDGLEDFPSRTLSAMHRKLRGVRGYVPSIQPPKCGRGRDTLVSLVRKLSMEMLSDLDEVDEPAEQLAGALGVAGLTLKLIMNRQAVRDFRKFSPEIEALQNDIAKAINLLNDKNRVSLTELKKVQHLLDPYLKLSVRSLRIAVRNLLTEYLFECSDMDKVPDCIVQTLDIINRRSQHSSHKKNFTSKIRSSPQEPTKEVIQNEVECVLTISAQAKEVVLSLLPRHEFDEDFAHAYMEDFEGSDSLSISDDDDDEEQVGDISRHYEFQSNNIYGQTESIGETNPAELNASVSTSERDDISLLTPTGILNAPLESMHITEMDSKEARDFVHSQSCKVESKPLDGQCTKQYSLGYSGTEGLAYSASLDVKMKQNLSSLSHSPASKSSHNDLQSEETTSCSTGTPKFIFSDFPVEEANVVSLQSRPGNQYLEVQEACDATSMVAYRFTGHVLDKLAKIKGLVLYQGDRLYLRSYSSVPDDSEESPHTLLTFEFSKIWNSVLQQ